MRLLTYSYRDLQENGWKIGPIDLGNSNLFVGLTASGKTRILNTITNFAIHVSKPKNQAKEEIKDGEWYFKFTSSGNEYEWDVQCKGGDILKEKLVRKDTGVILERDSSKLIFKNTSFPSLDSKQLSVSMITNDEDMKNVNSGFSKIVRRNFNEDDLKKLAAISIDDSKDDKALPLNMDSVSFTMAQRLAFIKRKNRLLFDNILKEFRNVFSDVSSIDVLEPQKVKGVKVETSAPFHIPLYSIVLEEGGEQYLLQDAAAGMQKTLLIIMDIHCLPDDSIYIIDEIENSLGENALPQIAEILNNHSDKFQSLLTSHSPFIINNFNMCDWLIVKRKGKTINITKGLEFKEMAGSSRLESYTLLQKYLAQ